TSHSRRSPAARSPQISRPKWTKGRLITVVGVLCSIAASPCLFLGPRAGSRSQMTLSGEDADLRAGADHLGGLPRLATEQVLENPVSHHSACTRDQCGHGSRPSRLMAGADAGTVVAVEVLVEQDQVAPVGVGLELGGTAVD